MQQVNGLMCSILAIHEITSVPEDTMKPKLPTPFTENGLSLLISKSFYTQKEKALDDFLKAEHLSKKECGENYWEISNVRLFR